MGQQQLLLIILGVIIVGIAIAVGLSLFSAQSVASNKDAIINDLGNLAATAYQYKIRPTSMGGGGGTYGGFTIPSKMLTNDNATYALVGAPGATVVYIATSSNGTVTATVDVDGKLGTWVYTGSFL